jgi:hypothetical protein
VTLVGGDGDDTLTGAGGADVLIAGIGENVLTGGAGVDRFYAGLEQNRLVGGLDDDYYVFLEGLGANNIVDTQGKNVMEFSGTTPTAPRFPSQNNGVFFAPGHSPGIETFTSLALKPADTLQIEIGGTQPGEALDNHDQVQVSGAVVLDGVLDVVMYRDFMPEVGDEFVIMTFASASGSFDLVKGLELNDRVELELIQDATSLRLPTAATSARLPRISGRSRSARPTIR